MCLAVVLIHGEQGCPRRCYNIHSCRQAASLHALAGNIYASSHANTEMKPQKSPEGHYRAFHGTDRLYVDFFQVCYFRLEEYPLGLSNVLG